MWSVYNDCLGLFGKCLAKFLAVKIKGVFLQADIKNRNGRVYPKEILQKEVSRYNREFVNKNRAFGELGHPDGPVVNLERVNRLTS